MFDGNALRELLEYNGQFPVVSVYLNADVAANRRETVLLALKNLLKQVESEQDAQAVLNYVMLEWNWSGRGLAIFSSQAADFFQVWPLSLPVPNYSVTAARPYVKPLADLLDNYGHYGVALVDKQGVRLFFFHLGELIEQEGALGESIRQSRRGASDEAEASRQNRTREMVIRNLKEAAEFSARFFAEKRVRKVVLAGTEENVAEFRDLLPKRWQSLLVGSIKVNMSASFEDIRQRVMDLCAQAEARQEARMVEEMVTLAAKGKAGVLGLDETLSAAHEGRVQTLLVQEGFAAQGWRCQKCGYVTTQPLETCPFCGGHFAVIPDAVEMAVRKVLEDGGEVDVVRHVPRMSEIGIGALLRY